MRILHCVKTLDDAAKNAVKEAIAADSPIVLPTDTVYGIGGNPASTQAVNNVLAAKGRDRQMPPPVLISSPTEVDLVAKNIPQNARILMEKFWPGALTLILETGDLVNYDLGDMPDTIAVRMPNHPVALEILKATGPLAVTSANLTGAEPATDCAQATEYFGDKVALYFDAGATPGPVPSTIVKFNGENLEILRAGLISETALQQAIAGN
ncbi:Sua5/YciO/YrdC/YwlC family protein [Gleimia coleocanis DSM 15436]|uniref:L-threonylcarbamoyladenylate synthase n=1 Tax=Gleimia coleocanis DSM 15436 TaxID=525245 RepID=C0VZZ6_9ACTO|nr:L-threonylcarbamoyladenylate synthase [Gleimia coleocanis]EEH63855.1 Sua5/YciO/YrdC/YwlC family protein [Gleimia coleocanis DSM 15436]